jgi:inosose dehydratase
MTASETVAEAGAAADLVSLPIGVVPIVWNNVDLRDLGPEVPATDVLAAATRLGFAGVQFGRGFPEGEELVRELQASGLRLAERYCELPSDREGLAIGARSAAFDLLERTIASGGEVLVVALAAGGERDAWAGRALDAAAPRWPEAAVDELAELLVELAVAAGDRCRVAFHPHAATWIETADEVDRLADGLTGTTAGLCLDVGHFLVGGGDPVRALLGHGALVTHIHLKDVDAAVLARLRGGELPSFADVIRARIFTELGNGILDLPGVLRQLAANRYQGWLMVEQDSTWLGPTEAAAIGLRVLRFALREVERGRRP